MLKSRRGQRKNLISRRTIDLPNVRNKENTLKNWTQFQRFWDFDNRVNICIIKVQIEKGEAGKWNSNWKIMVEISCQNCKRHIKTFKDSRSWWNGINPQIQNKTLYSNFWKTNPKTTFENIRGNDTLSKEAKQFDSSFFVRNYESLKKMAQHFSSVVRKLSASYLKSSDRILQNAGAIQTKENQKNFCQQTYTKRRARGSSINRKEW